MSTFQQQQWGMNERLLLLRRKILKLTKFVTMYVSTYKFYMLTLTVLYVVSRSSERGQSLY